MSYLTQMLGLTVQNFLSAATGMAVLVAVDPRLRPALRPDDRQLLGGPDPRHALYPAAAGDRPGAGAGIARAWCRPCSGSQTASLLQPARRCRRGRPSRQQVIAVGPAASQVAIKQLGTNGGGFFNVNSAHPFENPTPLSNFLEMLAILLIPAALCYTFGRMVGDTRKGWAILAAMTVIFVAMLSVAVWAEQRGNPALARPQRRPGGQRRAARRQHGGQGGALRRRPTRRSGPPPPPPPPTAR